MDQILPLIEKVEQSAGAEDTASILQEIHILLEENVLEQVCEIVVRMSIEAWRGLMCVW